MVATGRDTTEGIQVGEDEFMPLEEFVKVHGLRRVVCVPYDGPGLDPARHKGRYSVIVFKSGTVLRCFVTGISHSAYLMVASASRTQTRYEIRPHMVAEIYQ